MSKSVSVLSEVVQKIVQDAHRAGKAIVLVTGVFDILHSEHRFFLEKAKAAGDVLIVGLESDARVRQLKGAGRPINAEHVRQQQLEALGLADGVFILPEKFDQPADHEALIAAIKPAILAVSSHSPHLEGKQRIMAKFGGVVKIVHEHNPAVSTTQILAAEPQSAAAKNATST